MISKIVKNGHCRRDTTKAMARAVLSELDNIPDEKKSKERHQRLSSILYWH